MAEKIFDEFKRNLTKGLPVALATIIEGPGQGAKLLLLPDGSYLGSLGNEKINSVLSRDCLLYTSPSPRDKRQSRMPSSA